jgi:lipopolysaccharide/colanic/teichoic acid biosynthesis glycosyltransferase
MSEYRAKRPLDLLLASGALLISAPLFLPLSVAIALRLGRPILFTQRRPGLGGRPFTIYKFRTMRELVDADGQLLPDAERLTPLGRFLRATSLDELPELLNIVKGEMSFVGPRPLLMQYLQRYDAEQMRRHQVRPGLTGWAQVHGRNAQTWEERFNLDCWYVDHCSLGLDLRILFLTIGQVLRREGISQQGHATMPEFLGSPSHTEKR